VNGQGEEYTRLGEVVNRQNLIVGEWLGTRDMDGQKVQVHWIFSTDSNALLMIRFISHSGAYTVKDGRLVATFDGRVGLDGRITLVGNVLTISRSGGRMTKLIRY
jgi:hypothetical protein